MEDMYIENCALDSSTATEGRDLEIQQNSLHTSIMHTDMIKLIWYSKHMFYYRLVVRDDNRNAMK